METASEATSFKEAERAGWSEKAPVYDDFAGRITAGAVDPLLDAVCLEPDMAFLDICCGTGTLAAEAARRGAHVTAIDFAAPMIAEARRRFPAVTFAEGDAEALHFPPGASTPPPAPSEYSTLQTPTVPSPKPIVSSGPAAAMPSPSGRGRPITTSSASSATPSPFTAETSSCHRRRRCSASPTWTKPAAAWKAPASPT